MRCSRPRCFRQRHNRARFARRDARSGRSGRCITGGGRFERAVRLVPRPALPGHARGPGTTRNRARRRGSFRAVHAARFRRRPSHRRPARGCRCHRPARTRPHENRFRGLRRPRTSHAAHHDFGLRFASGYVGGPLFARTDARNDGHHFASLPPHEQLDFRFARHFAPRIGRAFARPPRALRPRGAGRTLDRGAKNLSQPHAAARTGVRLPAASLRNLGRCRAHGASPHQFAFQRRQILGPGRHHHARAAPDCRKCHD